MAPILVHENYSNFDDEHDDDQEASNNNSNKKKEETEIEECDDYNYDDEEIQKDAATDLVAYIVYFALSFFLLLFFLIMISIILIVQQYGFIIFAISAILVTFVFGLGKFLLHVIEEDKVMKPIQKKIRRWHAVATAVVVNEMKNFHMDLNDHLLLTYDEHYQDGNNNGDGDNNDYNSDGIINGKKSNRTKDTKVKKKMKIKGQRGPRSRLFALLVQPLLKKKNGNKRFFNSNNKKNKNKNQNLNISANESMNRGINMGTVPNVDSDDYAFV